MSARRATNYTEEFKKSSAKLAFESEQPVSKTAQELGINPNTIHGWINKYYPSKQVPDKKGIDFESDNKRLRKELQRITMERDILKKAAAYFASETL
jgi:transposase-like protein